MQIIMNSIDCITRIGRSAYQRPLKPKLAIRERIESHSLAY